MSMLTGYPQQMTQSAVNCNQALQYVMPLLGQMVQCGQINQQEYQLIASTWQSQQNIARFTQRIASTFGEMAVAPQQLQAAVQQLLTTAINTIRVNQQQVMTPQSYGVVNQPMMPVGGYAQPVSQPAVNVGDIYGNQAQNDRVTSPYPEQNMQHPTIQEQPSVQATVPKPQPTGKPMDIDLHDPYRVLAAPKWTPMAAPVTTDVSSYYEPSASGEEAATAVLREGLDPNIETVGGWMSISCHNVTVESATISVETPMTTTEGMVADLAVNHPEIVNVDKTFAHVVAFKEIVIGRAPFGLTKELFTDCGEAMHNTAGIGGIVNVLKLLSGRSDRSASMLTDILLERFNNAASVNFMKLNELGTGMKRIGKFTGLPELSRLITDSGDYSEWKEDHESFAQALRNCIKASFNSLFDQNGKGYLDVSADNEGVPADNRARLLVLSDERTGFRFGVKGATEVSRLVPFLRTADAAEQKLLKDSISAKLKTIFPFTIERKVLLHNLNLPSIEPSNFRAEWLHNTPEALILFDFFSKHGALELVDINDLSQMHHPLMLGVSYGTQLLIRRV